MFVDIAKMSPRSISITINALFALFANRREGDLLVFVFGGLRKFLWGCCALIMAVYSVMGLFWGCFGVESDGVFVGRFASSWKLVCVFYVLFLIEKVWSESVFLVCLILYWNLLIDELCRFGHGSNYNRILNFLEDFLGKTKRKLDLINY